MRINEAEDSVSCDRLSLPFIIDRFNRHVKFRGICVGRNVLFGLFAKTYDEIIGGYTYETTI